MDEVAKGQRMLILAILVNLGALVLRGALGNNWGVIGPVAAIAVVAAIIGLLRLATGLGYPAWKQALLVILVFVPLISLLMLAMVNGRATKALRAAGYKVGFFGATGKRETV